MYVNRLTKREASQQQNFKKGTATKIDGITKTGETKFQCCYHYTF